MSHRAVPHPLRPVVGVPAVRPARRAAGRIVAALAPMIALMVSTAVVGVGSLGAQDHTLSTTPASGAPGTTVTVSVLLDNSEPVRGYSVGLAHDGAIVTLDTIEQGAALLAANGGAGPDFFFEDIAPANGPGGTSGAVLSFAAPLDDIPVGPGSELVVHTYTVLAGALPGTAAALDFVDTLGDPPLETLVSVAGITRVPVGVSGQIDVVTAPVSGLGCALVDPCTCTFDLDWTNQGTYDAIDILEDGVVVQTLAGNATSASVSIGATTIGGPEGAVLAVVPRQNAVEAEESTCDAICPDVPDPIEPSGLTCSVDPFTGLASLDWSNGQAYPMLEVSVDGAFVASLPGVAVSTTVSLPSPGTYTICLDGGDDCGVAFSSVCCVVVYEQVFVRGDINADGGFNISDPIFGLEYLFGGGPLFCAKALDVNDSGATDLADIIFTLGAIFGLGGLPGAPFPDCGVDPTPDGLSCDDFAICP